MKNGLFRTVRRTALIGWVALIPQASEAAANCPQGWVQDVVEVNVSGVPCPVSVVYCFPDPYAQPPITPLEQIEIQEISVDDWACAGLTITPDLYTEIGTATLEASANGQSHCDAVGDTCSSWCDDHPTCFCPSAHAEWSITAGGCFKTTGIFSRPCYGVSRCIQVYQVCCRDGQPEATWLASAAENLNCEYPGPGCSPVCDNGATSEVGCCDTFGNPQAMCPNGRCPDPAGECR